MDPLNDKVYTPAQCAWLEYVTVGVSKFDYSMVWHNQTGDVHPPLYYALVHTICSLFAGNFSIWYAGSLNLLFTVLTLWVFRHILGELTQSPEAMTFGSLFFILSSGILSTVSFLRMYSMAMFEVTFITWLFIRAVKKGCDFKFYVTVIFISVMGALTHYYFIVYLFFLCHVFGLYLLVDKQYRNVLFFIASMGVSGGAAVCIFPDMLKHMFSEEGYRGQQSIENLKQVSVSEYIGRLRIFYDDINEQLFGGILSYLLIFILLLVICELIWGKIKFPRKKNAVMWMLVMGPGICYLLLVSKMAVMMESRYIWPIYAVMLSGGFSLLYIGIDRLCREEKKRRVIVCIFISVMLVNGWKTCSWEYLFFDSEYFLEKTAQFTEEDVIYIYDGGWKLSASFYEAGNYKNAVFIPVDEMEKLKDLSCNVTSLIVCITDSCDIESILKKILDLFPLLSKYEAIGGYGYTVTYHLSD